MSRMRLFGKRETEPTGVEPFDEWSIVSHLPGGVEATLRGYVVGSPEFDAGDWLRYVEAIASGLRAAGFDAELTLKRETVEHR